jgi:hypothetical protein
MKNETRLLYSGRCGLAMDLTMPHEKLIAWNLNVLQRKDRFGSNSIFFVLFASFSLKLRDEDHGNCELCDCV